MKRRILSPQTKKNLLYFFVDASFFFKVNCTTWDSKLKQSTTEKYPQKF